VPVREVAVRVVNRAKREAIGRVPPMRSLAESRYQGRLREHQSLLPRLAPQRARLVDAVRDEGVCVSSLDQLGLPGTAQLKAGLMSLTGALARRPGIADTTRPPLSEILAESGVWQWGLSEELLDLAEAYLGLPARYYGADLRREQANARTVGVRQWHRDVEDHRMFKVLVWLNDVDLDGGPFEYVPRRHTQTIARELRYVTGFVTDEALEAQVPRSEWRQATGPLWTAVLSDTRSVFHRAMPPRSRDRYSVTFSYTSRTPMTTVPVPPVTEEERALAVRGLDDRQRACLSRAFG
jgi:hypothetical protein